MSAPPEAIARRLAARFASELGARLPVLVERALADEQGEETPFRSADPAQVLQFASFVVALAGGAWGIYMGLWQKSQAARSAADAEAEKEVAVLKQEVAALKEDTAFLKGMLLTELRAKAPRPRELAEPVRERLLEAAADEALAEAAGSRPRR
jgi:hypothetical protein